MARILNLVRPGETAPTAFKLGNGNYIIGRSENAPISLRYPEVSERHAILSIAGDSVTIKDLRSANGVYVNGTPIGDVTFLSAEDVVQIGNCYFRVADESAAAPAAREETGGAKPSAGNEAGSAAADEVGKHVADAQVEAVKTVDPLADVRRQVRSQITSELIERLDLKRMTANGVNREGLEATAREKIHDIVSEVKSKGLMPSGIDAARIEREVFNEALRLGPLEDLLADEAVTEIMVNGPHQVYVERRGKLELSDLEFTDDQSVMAVIERIVSPLGRRIDESQPYVDARLADGSRVNAIIPPLSLSGPTITIRKFAKKKLTVEDFIRFGTWNRNAAEFMKACVMLRKNIVVAGGTGSGKTTLLNLLSNFIPHDERIVTVEDAAELKLAQPHVVRLEARPPNIEGKGAVTIRDLVKNCLRMRPDRIIVGECRGGEALDMLQAMNTGHDGSLTTVHANSPRDVISRLETMVLMSGMELPSKAIREQIASAVDVVIHESRLSDGSRKVVAISEVTGLEGNQIVMQDIFAFTQTGVDDHGKILGAFRPTGAVPTFYETLKSRGMQLDPAMFDPNCDRDIYLKVIGRK